MQIVFHLGAHCTDSGLLIRSILRNRAALAREGIGVPGPARYRELIGDISTKLRGAKADEATEDLLIETIRDDDTADRIILSNENFLCRPDVVLAPDGLYPKAAKAAWLRSCVPGHEVEFALSIRNPATFLPDLMQLTDPSGKRWLDMMAGIHLGLLQWSGVVSAIAAAVPDARILVWCHEDTPFIWSELIREITGHDAFTRLDGEFDMLSTIMSEAGMSRLRDFLDQREVTNEAKRRRAIAAFLEAHALEDQIEAEIDLPGWTDDTVADLTELYEQDIERIRHMPQAELIEP